MGPGRHGRRLIRSRQDYCFPWEVRFLRGRVRFPGRGHGGAPFPSMVVVMGPPARPGRVFGWDLRQFNQLSVLDDERLVPWPGAHVWNPLGAVA